MRFPGKVFLVTGGGRGIGRAIAKRLADDGGRVWIADADPRAGRDAADEYGDRVRFERCDVSREAEVRRALSAVVKWGGRLDGVVANAGLANPHVGKPERLTLAKWQKYLDINLTGTFRSTMRNIRWAGSGAPKMSRRCARGYYPTRPGSSPAQTAYRTVAWLAR